MPGECQNIANGLDGTETLTYLPYAIKHMEDMMKIGVSVTRVREVFSYDPDEGILRWRVSNTNRIKVGDVAGSIATNGRRYVYVDDKQYLVPRLIWLYVTGEDPKGYVRQRDNDYDNNRWENLYEATPSATNFARDFSGKNKTGFRGISWNKLKNKFQAKIKLNGKDFHLGYFETAEEGHAARQAAEARIPEDITAEDFAFLGDEVKADRWRHKLWDHMLAQNNGVVGWATFDAFAAEIGTPESPNHRIERIDLNRAPGPGNWQMLPPLAAEYDLSNVVQRRSYNRERHRRNPNLDRNSGLKSRYGVDLAWVQQQLLAQDGVCAICRKPETQITKGGKLKSLVVDHAHLDGKKKGPVRGILCHACNSGLGYFQDSIDILEAAIAYLRRRAKKDEVA